MLSKIKTVEKLSWFLGVNQKQLLQLEPENHYVVFEVPKLGTNEKRKIEAPTGILKYLLDRLSDGLQWIYSEHRTPAAQGYIRSVKNDPDKRTIFTNAKKHLGKKYMLNIDLDNFFHQITSVKVAEVFSNGHFFSFNQKTIDLLVKLVCYKGRLPMGSPTSPPLSNFAVIDLDYELLLWAKHQKITYTRFVDDLTFSSNKPITQGHFRMINDMLHAHVFIPDSAKIKWFGKDDKKEVTGLIVGTKISVPSVYLTELEFEINKLEEIRQYISYYPDYAVLEWVQKLAQVISGRLAFVKSVYGSDSEEYRLLMQKTAGGNKTAPVHSLSWRYAGYEFFA